MSDQAIGGAIGGAVIGAIVLALGLLYIRIRLDRHNAARRAQQEQSRRDDESYFAGLRFTDETLRAARREHGWCSCIPYRHSCERRVLDPHCPVHQGVPS